MKGPSKALPLSVLQNALQRSPGPGVQQIGVWIQQAQAKGQGKDKDKGGKRAGLYSPEKECAAIELESFRDPPTPPMSRRRKDSVDSSVYLTLAA